MIPPILAALVATAKAIPALDSILKQLVISYKAYDNSRNQKEAEERRKSKLARIDHIFSELHKSPENGRNLGVNEEFARSAIQNPAFTRRTLEEIVRLEYELERL